MKYTGKIKVGRVDLTTYNKNTKGTLMSNSKFISTLLALGLSVKEVEVQVINPIVFKTSVNANNFGQIVKDGDKVYIIDTKGNTADELTPKTVQDLAIAGYTSAKPTDAQRAAISATEATGTLVKVVAEKNDKGTVLGLGTTTLSDLCKATGMEVVDVEVLVQNDIIFKTTGLKTLPDLVQDDGKYYQIDVNKNEATVVDAESLKDQAVADIKAGKNTNASRFASAFGLISSITLQKKV